MTVPDWDRDATLHRGLALSLLLHLLLVAIWQLDALKGMTIFPSEPAMEVEIVRDQPKPTPPPPPQPVPSPPKPEMARPDPVPVPQLRPGKLAEKSSAPKTAAPAARDGRDGKVPPPVAPVGELSQTAQDMVLAQVVKLWRFDTEPAKGSDLTISMSIVVNRDGTLGDAMHKNAPWNPRAAIRGYDQLSDPYVRRALESLLLALRLAQPLQLPPDDGKGWPRRMVIRFRPGDL